jgi:hypothetical protein
MPVGLNRLPCTSFVARNSLLFSQPENARTVTLVRFGGKFILNSQMEIQQTFASAAPRSKHISDWFDSSRLQEGTQSP